MYKRALGLWHWLSGYVPTSTIPPGFIVKREYSKNGLLLFEHLYHLKQKHGTLKAWWDNGKPMYEQPHYRGKSHGIEKRWRYNGKLDYEKYYIHGKEVTHAKYEATNKE